VTAQAPREPLRFTRAQRVKRSGDFQRAFRAGGRARGRWLVVVALPTGATTRLGLSVGRAIWKRAVARNRLRRLFREAFRLTQAELPPGFDLVLVPAAPRIEPSLAELRAELVELAAIAARRAEYKAQQQLAAAAAAAARAESGA
jgi:ribonuclease P protein component